MESNINQPDTVARVKHVTSNGKVVYLELRNGNIATCDSSQAFDVAPGDVVLISDGSDGVRLNRAPAELWLEESWVGIVRLAPTDRLVVEVNGRLRIIERPGGLDIQQGYTVEGTDVAGVTGVLSPTPIRLIDLPEVDEATVDRFKHSVRSDLSFEDFGGYEEIVARARELIEIPLEKHDELAKIGARPIKGVLLTGEPGTGKTLLARIIANQTDAIFYEISGPEILSKWYGQSEELIRKIFEDAARQKRAIAFFDEIDSLAVQRGDDTNEVSRRIVGQLLTAIDGFKANTNVVVVATTNRPDDVDRALRRPGRFDWQIDFPSPTARDREAILTVSARPLSVGEDLPYALIAGKTNSWTPAELSAIWSEAALLAATDSREEIFVDDFLGGFERVSRQRARLLAEKPKSNQEDTAR